MNEQYLSIDQCKELVALGIDMQNAYMGYLGEHNNRTEDEYSPYPTVICDCKDSKSYRWNGQKYICLDDKEQDTDFYYIPTFTLSDILSIIKEYTIDVFNFNGIIHYNIQIEDKSITSDISLINAAFSMLKWCKENNHI